MTTIKKIIQIIGVFILTGIMLLAAGKMYFVDGGVDLDKSYNITGQIITAYKKVKELKTLR
jgi:hypothetical protein